MGDTTQNVAKPHYDVYQLDENTNDLTEVVDGHKDNFLHNYQLTKDRAPKEIRKPIRFVEADSIYYVLVASVELNFNEPTTYKEFMPSKGSNKWIRVIDDEYQSLMVPKPPNAKIVKYRWLFKLKKSIEMIKPTKFKARIIAHGFSQVKGVYCNEIFSPMTKYTYIRFLLSIIAHAYLHLEQMDEKIEFLHGELEERVMME